MYAKLIDNDLDIAPSKLPGDGVTVYNPPDEMYLEQGWKPVTFTDPPGDPPAGYQYESGWEETTGAIVQTWQLVELPDDIDEAEAWEILFGEGET